ncbi:unnamed protein product [Symbiodinium pilosum]|uniref:CCDC81 HU domain-containing protein n=1 Tax=Symbiodinium pilosum TaxID=2952 RepID=A0A812IU62_SYMPI|nr:unnamed protein product [Symbiodinium pilosum]
MLTFDGLVQDIIQRRGRLGTKEGSESAREYQEAWSAYAAYVRSCLEQRRGLQLSSFCKLGWAQQKKLGKTTYRPYSQFSDSFNRAYVSESRKTPANDLCPFEDFNFSKAALKFSNLTKDQVFTMLRALVQRIGESVADGRELDLAFGDVGRFMSKDRELRFLFAQEFYRQEGLTAPSQGGQGGSAPSFRKEISAEAASLGVHASSGVQDRTVDDQPTMMMHLGCKLLHLCHQILDTSMEGSDVQGFDGGAQRAMPTVDPQHLQKSESTPGLTGTQFKKEIAFKEAMDRHIAAMEAHAVEAVAEKEAWDSHVSECLLQEREEIQARKERNNMNLQFLKHQMALGEHKRKEQRKDDIEAASAHDFPSFSEVHPNEMKDFIKGQQAKVRQALDEQVRTNNTLRNLAKQKDLALELNQLQANREELAMLRDAERAKKAYDKEALATAWNADIRMKNIWKAIDNHSKVATKTASQVSLNDALPPSRAGSTVSAGRLMTGSQRRTPLGCSTSLSQLEAHGLIGLDSCLLLSLIDCYLRVLSSTRTASVNSTAG